MRTALAAALIIVGIVGVVNAARPQTLSDLVKDANAHGETEATNPNIVKLDGVAPGLMGKTLEIDAKDSADGATHDFTVFFDKGMPVVAIFTVIRDRERQSEFLNLACDVHGKLNRCSKLVGANDEAGRPIRGSEQVTILQPQDKETKAALRHELDFWLKRKYRRSSRPATS